MTVLSARDIPLRTVKVEFEDGSTRDVPVTQIRETRASPDWVGMDMSAAVGPLSGPEPDWSVLLPGYDVDTTVDGRYFAHRSRS